MFRWGPLLATNSGLKWTTSYFEHFYYNLDYSCDSEVKLSVPDLSETSATGLSRHSALAPTVDLRSVSRDIHVAIRCEVWYHAKSTFSFLSTLWRRCNI